PTQWAKLPPIGQVIPHAKIYILNQDLQSVPIGVTGELYIGGNGLARGYLNRSDLTAEKFLPDPFSDKEGRRLYRTGDLARYLADGNVEFLGRIDHQVKIRGFRVELSEIEILLRQHDNIREAVVVAWEYKQGQKRLIAYLVSEDGAVISSRELRSYLKEKLPEYMLPSVFIMLEDFPLTASGKLDRRALPLPDSLGVELEERYVAPDTPVEEITASIWSDLLGVEKVGRNDNFFELGGHSLLATRVISRIRETFQVDIALRCLFEQPTLTDLAHNIEILMTSAQNLSILPLVPVSRDRELPLSFSQQRLWFLHHLNPDSSAYNIPAAVSIKGSLNVSALMQSFNEIITRHEILRTVFSNNKDGAIQIIQPTRSGFIPLLNLRELSTTKQQAEVWRLAVEEAQRPFNLTKGPLLRVKLLCLDKEEYVLLVTMHHIISDGWSITIFINELALLYKAFVQGKPSPLSRLPIQYADFAQWQRKWLQGEVLTKQLTYWHEQLGGELPVLALPTDRPRPVIQTFRGATKPLTVSQTLSGDLQQLSRYQGVTLFMTLLGAFQTLLYRYSGQSNIVVGTPIANRQWKELEGLIGFFVNTLVIRTDFTGEPRFCEILKQVREVALGAYAHQDIPFEKLVEELQPQRNLSYSPLFQVSFALQNISLPTIELTGLTLDSLEIDSSTAKFDLVLAMQETPQGLQAIAEYNVDLFDETTIDRMLSHFTVLLKSIVIDPEQTVTRFQLLTTTEQQQLLVQWNSTYQEYPQDKCIQELFEEQVIRTPDQIAVVFEEQELSYQELNRRGNQLAHYLRGIGVGAEVIVGICMERSPEMIVAIIAVHKAGGAYLPLDPDYPLERLTYMLDDSQVQVLLTQARLLEKLPTQDKQTICLDTQWVEIARESIENPINIVSADNLAYVIYTSGSTGRPKGVMIRHRGLINLALTEVDILRVTPQSRLLQFASLNFDASVFEIFVGLITGARLYLRRKEQMLSGLQFAEWLQKEQISIMLLPSTLLAMLPTERLPQLQTVISGGEACTRQVAARWCGSEKGRQFLNAYGPTEVTVCATITEIKDSEKITIGKPISNMEVYILDKYMQPLPVGVSGELYIGGAGLARGYLRQAAITAEKFVPHPFTNIAGARLYKTGDIGHYLLNGDIVFDGRIDQQVKVRGYRIELGEIEAVLAECAGVRECVVIMREEEPNDKRLIAYLVAVEGVTLSQLELRDQLRQKLPEYMLPATLVILDNLPSTPNGKIDRNRLPAPDRSQVETTNFVAPTTELEQTIADIWKEVLKVEKVSIYDNFFDIGGHSLLMIQIYNRLSTQLSQTLSMIEIFKYPTINSLAEYLGQQKTEYSTQPQNHKRGQVRRESVAELARYRQQQQRNRS
ncbi:MAG: amino acid adenylation domain-containing protein, partial [Acidobacteriota bacterium]